MSTPTATAASSWPTASFRPSTAAPWRLPLNMAVVEGEVTHLERRSAVFRLGSTGLTLSHAAAGYLDGFVTLAGRQHAARRTDGDGNGRFTDPQDRLWIDIDDNGRWDPVDEQFLYSSVLTIAGGRFAVHSDEYGRRLSLDVLEGDRTCIARLQPPTGQSPRPERDARRPRRLGRGACTASMP